MPRFPRTWTVLRPLERIVRRSGQPASIRVEAPSMLFNSPIFLFAFLPATVGLYVLLRQFYGPRAVLGLLLGASLLFYGWWNPLYLPLLGGIAVFNFIVARRITAQRLVGRADRVRLLLIFGIVVDVLVLGYFKYTDFLIDTANAVLQTDFMLQHILLPLGISFFTFQKIAYLVDSARGEVIEHDFLEYCFFVMFFPQLLAGPITHHSEIFPQIKGPWAFAIKPSNFMLGLTIFVIGLFKKVVLADSFAPLVSSVYDMAAAGQILDFFTAWQGAIAFKFQLYFDFSGYSEMALGAAWHFVMWGSLQGSAMVLNHAWRSVWRPINAWWSNTVARLVTFFGLTMVLVTHRAPSMAVAMQVYRGMFNLPAPWHDAVGPLAAGLGWLGVCFDGPPVTADQRDLVLWLIVWLAVVWFLPNTQQMLARWHPAFNYGVAERERAPPLIERVPAVARLLPWRLEWRPSAAAAVFIGLLAALAFLNLHHVSEFLYFRY